MSTAEFANVTGVSKRQLQLWCEAGLLKPALEGGSHRRSFDPEDAWRVRLIRDLKRVKGYATTRQVRQVLREIERREHARRPCLLLFVGPKRCYFDLDGAERILATLRSADKPAWLIEVM